MQIQVNSDKNIRMDARLVSFVQGESERALERYQGRLMRLEVHLSDVNSHKFGPEDKRCRIEARPARRQPVVVTMTAGNVRAAVQGSLAKLQNALEKYFGRKLTKARLRGHKPLTILDAKLKATPAKTFTAGG